MAYSHRGLQTWVHATRTDCTPGSTATHPRHGGRGLSFACHVNTASTVFWFQVSLIFLRIESASEHMALQPSGLRDLLVGRKPFSSSKYFPPEILVSADAVMSSIAFTGSTNMGLSARLTLEGLARFAPNTKS